jgi:alanine-glyoxylate transaminase / serine-glyoxylate transaminase / serine-pyruvate transaminase
MSVGTGREFLAVAGPATIPDEALRAMRRQDGEIYSRPNDSLLCDLSRLSATAGAVTSTSPIAPRVDAALGNVPSISDQVVALKSDKFAVDRVYDAARFGPALRFLKATGASPRSSAA